MEGITKDIFLVSVGGSGTRVIESLVHMLAIGGKSQKWPDKIHILIMEMDTGNGNLQRLNALLRDYHELRKLYCSFSREPRFFIPEIVLYQWLPMSNNSIQDSSMKNMVSGNDDAEILSKLLYTQDEMEMKIDMGFKGRPSVGVAYFRQAAASDRQLDAFLDAAKDCDRIMVVSSCHGGTGATGIPVLEKLIHRKKASIKLGLLLMLPTFCVPKDPENKATGIDSDSFADKVKTVMSYYASEHILCESEGKGYCWTYLLGYHEPVMFEKYSEGKQSQTNPVTLFDWFACAAIKQFYSGEVDPNNSLFGMRPGIYICYIDEDEWGFNRFSYTFPSLARDITIMLQSVIIFKDHILPALQGLCNINSDEPQKLGTQLGKSPVLKEFFPSENAEINRTDIQAVYTLFDQYASRYIIWLYEIMSHIPVDFPDSESNRIRLAFHGIEKVRRRDLKKSFKNIRPEQAQSLIAQMFINAPILYRAQCSLENGQRIERDRGTEDAFLRAVLNSIENMGEKYSVTHRLDTITQERGTPSISAGAVLGCLWETYLEREFAIQSDASSDHMSIAGQSTAELIFSLLETVEQFHGRGIGKEQ